MRAHRLLPHSPDIALKLGLYWLTRDRAQARLWFERAAETAESREIWLGLALLRAGAAREAAIAHLLTRFAPPADNPAFAALAAEHPELRPSAARLAEVEGCVWEEENGDIAGWAWQPAAPDTQSVVTLCDTDGHRRSLFADADMRPLRPLTQPRGFSLPAASLRGWADEIHIIDPSGRDLPGSPIFRGVWRKPPPAGERVARPIAAAPARKVAVVVPVYRNRSLTRACLATLRASAPDAPVFVVDDATPEPALARDLDRMAQRGQIVLIRHSRNRGFPDSANAGLRAALALKEPHDVVLLNADVVLPRGQRNSWLNRLRASVHAQDDIASATPFSNAGGPLSYPQRDGDNPAFHLAQLDRLAARVNAGQSADIPTGVGFCLYLRNEALHAVGLLRENVFAQGYGEENDWCRRAAAFGWRHVGAGDVVVQHHEAQSFGAAKAALMARNTQMMARLHPGYLALVRDWAGTAPPEDTLATLRRNLDLARLRQLPHKPTTLLVSHCAGGGVERAVQTRRGWRYDCRLVRAACRGRLSQPRLPPAARSRRVAARVAIPAGRGAGNPPPARPRA
jgi:GT2 family glycosyltransferase